MATSTECIVDHSKPWPAGLASSKPLKAVSEAQRRYSEACTKASWAVMPALTVNRGGCPASQLPKAVLVVLRDIASGGSGTILFMTGSHWLELALIRYHSEGWQLYAGW
ncbi:hypothetical protein D9M73_208150 [compost metagenome]